MVIPTPRVFPRCPKCENNNFSSQLSNFKKIPVLIIYCDSCGAILGIVNTKEKTKD
jgi:transcription elongation factor Elf1